MRRGILVVIALVIVGASLVYWFGFRAPPSAPQGMHGGVGAFAVPVEANKVKLDAIVETVSAVGSLRSEESVPVSSEVPGRVSEISANEGEAVKRGAVLVRLENSIFRAEVAQAKARLELSEANHKRASQLETRGAGTVRALDEAAASLRIDRSAVELAETRLRKTEILAPFDGVLGLRRISVGKIVEPGEQIINLEAIDTLKVDFRVPEIHLTALRPDQGIEITIDAIPGRIFTGKVYAIDPQIEVAGRSIVVRAKVPNNDRMLRPGLFARVNLIIARRDGAIVVPERSIVPMGDDKFVFRVIEGKAAITKVRLGIRRDAEVEIREGLTPADVVIDEGLMKIGDGAPVTVVPRPAGAS